MTFAARVLQDPTQPVGELVTASAVNSAVNPIPYVWFDSGFGGTLPTVVQKASPKISFNSARNVLAFVSAETNTIGLSIYKWSNTGFGTKYTIPTPAINGAPYYTIAPNTYSFGNAVTFSPADDVVAFGVNAADSGQVPFALYQWNNITGVGAKYIPLFTVPGMFGVHDIVFSPANDVLVVAGVTETIARRWSSVTGFGTAYTLPSAIQINDPGGVRFTPSGDAICFFSGSSLYAYPWTYASGFGAQYAAISPAIPGPIRDIAYSPAGDAIAIAHATSPFVSVYAWNSSTGFGAKYANPTSLPLGIGEKVRFSDSGNYLAVGFATSPYVYVYPWNSSTGFGSLFATPVTTPRGSTIAWRGA